jgi:hypothetical protein
LDQRSVKYIQEELDFVRARFGPHSGGVCFFPFPCTLFFSDTVLQQLFTMMTGDVIVRVAMPVQGIDKQYDDLLLPCLF